MILLKTVKIVSTTKKSVKNCEDGGVFASEPIDIVTVNKDGGEVNGGLDEENCIASQRSVLNMARSPEMAPRLVYRNKKYGRKSCPTNLKSCDQKESRIFDITSFIQDSEQDCEFTEESIWNNDQDKSSMKPTDASGPVATATAHGTPPAANGCSKNAKFLPISAAHKPTISESVTSNGGGGIEEEELNGEGIDILEPSSPQHCDIFSTSPVPPAGLFLGGGVNHGGVVVSESMMSSPPGLRSSHPHSVSALALVSPRENLWAADFNLIETHSSIISLGQTSSLGSEPSGCLEYAVFTALDTQNTGTTSVACLVEYWECLGISDPAQVLVDLGFSRDRQMVDLHHLSYLLIQEVNQSQEILRYITVWTAIQSFLAEIKVLKTILENHTRERDKLRADLQETNQRLTVLIQEGDEQTTRQDMETRQKLQSLECKYQEQLKEADRRFHEEKETNLSMLKAQSEESSKNLAKYKQEQDNLHQQIQKLLKDVSRLEVDNKALLKSKKEVACLTDKQHNQQEQSDTQLVQKDSGVVLSCAERSKLTLIEQELRDLTLVNKSLQDKNDEMETIIHDQRNQIDRLKNVQVINVRGSDSDQSCISKIQVGEGLNCMSPEHDTSITNIITDILKTENPRSKKEGPFSLPIISNKKRNPGVHLEQHCKHLEGKLDQVKFEIMRVLAEREAFSKENEALKQYKMAFLQLMAQNQNIQRDLEKLQIPAPFLDSPSSLSPDFPKSLKLSPSSLSPISKDSPDFSKSGSNILPDFSKALSSLSPNFTKDGNNAPLNFQQELSKEILVQSAASLTTKNQISFQHEICLKGVAEAAERGEGHSLTYSHQDILLCNPLEVHRSSPDGQEFDGGPLLKETLQITQLENDKQILEKERNLLKDEVTSLREENQELCNRCARLEEEMHLEMNRKDEVITSNRSKIQDMEQSLDMMKTEFESMEDYWQTKLEEERSFYEEQLRKNEDEFSKLEIQMNEYENMYDCNKKVEDDRLSTIEESCSMEAQISDWEDEIQQLKQQLEREQEQSKQLREQLHSDSQEMKELREELEDLEKKNIYMEEIQQQWSKKLAQVEESCRIKVSKLQEEITCKTSSFEHSKPGTSESEKEKAMWRLDLANPGHQSQPAVSLSNTGPQSLNEMGSHKSSTITFIPHSPRQGPSSLPSDLVTSAQREVKRLQELRRIIQEECDALLLKKERLKEEVGQLVTDGMILYSKDQSETTPINAVIDDTFDSMLLTEDITPTKSATKMHDDKIVGVINGDGESKMMLSFDETSFDKLVHSVSSIEQRLLALHKSPRNSSQESADNQDARASVKFDEAGLSNSHVTRKDAWTQLPSCLAGVGAAKSAVEGAEQHACLEEGEGHSHLDTISALLMAYKVVYMDIERERKQLELELEDNLEAVRTGCEGLQDGSVSSRGTDRTVQEAGSTSSNGGSDQVYLSVSIHGENGVYTCLKQRIEDQQSRCNQLQHALTRQKSETSRVLSSMKEQHREEVEQLEGLVASAQQLLTNQTQKYSQQMERLSLADRVIMELLSENETLNTALFSLQGQIRGGRSAAAVGTRVHQGQGGQGQADNSLAYNQGQGGEYSEDSSLDHDSYHSHNQPHSSENSHFVYQVEEI